MKKIYLVLLSIFGLLFLFSCEDEEVRPILDTSAIVPPSITSPIDTIYVLQKDSADSVFCNFEWTAVKTNLDNLAPANYTLQMDMSDSNFVNAVELSSSTDTSYQITIGSMNNTLLSMGLLADQEDTVEVRVKASVGEHVDDVYSKVLSLIVTPYSEVVYVKPIYLLGDATSAGWDNNAALEMEYIGDGKFQIETTINSSGSMIKFISVLGQWAPQWGTDANGTCESGDLVYRETEAVPDPPAIPAPVAGDYTIVADTANLTYQISLTEK